MGKPLSERTTMLFIHTTTVDHLLNTAWDLKQVESDCMQCKNYDVHFSCPSHAFSILEYVHQFKYALVAVQSIAFDLSGPMTLAEHFQQYKSCIDPVLMSLESESDGARAMLPGPCQNCLPDCESGYLADCPNPDLMRYSYESLGFDVATMIRAYFDMDLSFEPNQVQLVYGYLLHDPLPDSLQIILHDKLLTCER